MSTTALFVKLRDGDKDTLNSVSRLHNKRYQRAKTELNELQKREQRLQRSLMFMDDEHSVIIQFRHYYDTKDPRYRERKEG